MMALVTCSVIPPPPLDIHQRKDTGFLLWHYNYPACGFRAMFGGVVRVNQGKTPHIHCNPQYSLRQT